ncbi:MAG TPA: LanC-like protein [Dongiaceae bacterium]
MLYEAKRHEPLTGTPWDEQAAQHCMAAILQDGLDRFSAEDFWPPHPLDGLPAEQRHDLYLGSAGTIWALNILAGDPAFASPTSAGQRERLAEINRAWLAHRDNDNDIDSEPGLLTAGTGTLLVRAMLGGLESISEELAAHIDANGDSPVREFMWGSPGTMTAAIWLYEQTGAAIWAERFRRDAARLWDRLEFVEMAGCHLWVQHLYGHVAPFIGAVHGFAGNAFALLRGWDLLAAAEQTRWTKRLAQSLRATATGEEDGANWPQSVGCHRPARRSPLLQHCHGAPGIVTCFAGFPDAGISDAGIDDLLLTAGELTWRAGPLAKGAGLCHGTAGNGYAFLKLFRRSGDARWLNRARRFAMHAIGQQQRDTARYGQYRYALWTGDPGLAIYLANCIAGTDRFPTMDFFFSAQPGAKVI